MPSSPAVYSFDWPFVYGGPGSSFQFKSQLGDFVVTEQLGFELTGEGEHLCLWLQKEGLNTQNIAEQLSKFLTTRLLNIGFSGLKDRHAVTTQWFSIPVRIGEEFNAAGFCQLMNDKNPDEQIKIIHTKRHQKKIRRGIHTANAFQIRLRSLTYIEGGDGEGKQKIEQQLEQIKQHGFPNFFGEQRFGRNNQNVNRAVEWLSSPTAKKIKPPMRSFYLSAIRSYLFNQVLAERVKRDSWSQLLPGERIMLSGSHSVFQVEDSELDTLQTRLQEKDIHPTGPLFGVSDLDGSDLKGLDDNRVEGADRDKRLDETELMLLEKSILEPFSQCFKHEKMKKMNSMRRSLRAVPSDMQWSWQADDLILDFALPAGAYATALIRELGKH